MKYKKEMKLKGVEVERAPPPSHVGHCSSSSLQQGGVGAHSSECGREGTGNWVSWGGAARLGDGGGVTGLRAQGPGHLGGAVRGAGAACAAKITFWLFGITFST